MISAYLGTSNKFDRSVRDFSLGYADQVVKDYSAYRASIDSGAIVVAKASDAFDHRFVTLPSGRLVMGGPTEESTQPPLGVSLQ